MFYRHRVTYAILCGVLILAACAPRAATPIVGTGQPLHLVIDAGSSGTRLCLYAVERRCDPPQAQAAGPQAAGSGGTGAACACHAPVRSPNAEPPECQPIPDAGGLASMSPASASATLERGLHDIDAAVRRQIGGAALLGTGGFRLLGPTARTRLTGALREPLRIWLPAGATIRIGTLSGTDEGRLAWLAIREQEKSQAHAILETGGASVQFAAGRAGQSDYSVSLAVGMNRSFEKLAQHADFSVCFPFGAPDARTEFDRCRGLILREIFGGPEAGQLRARTAQYQAPLYGLGLPWQAIFEDMDRPAIAEAELSGFGRQVCATRQLSPAEQKGAFVQKRCYLYAFQSALLTQTGYQAIHRSRATTWARGAAVSDPFFPGCEPADISVYTKKELL